MNRFVLIISFILVAKASLGTHPDCDTILYPSATNTTWFNAGILGPLKPGYTLCLAPGKYYQLRLDSVSGHPESPVVVKPLIDSITIESDAHYGIRLGNSRHVKIEGSPLTDNYGLIIRNIQGMGINIDDYSTDIEISGVMIDSVSLSGIVAKTDPDCSLRSVRDSFLLQNLFIHHNLIRRTGNEGMYIGHTFYGGYTIHCNGSDTTVLPHLLANVDIYDNVMECCGFDAIQVSCASVNCQIHDNTIRFDSRAESYGQMSGINIGGGTVAHCFNNRIEFGKGMGIEVHGLGNTLIYNNLIINPGYNYKPGLHIQYSKSGIFIGNLYAKTDLLPIHIFNNTIINPKSDGIRQTSDKVRNCRIQNNAIINPGIFNYYQSNNIPTDQAYIFPNETSNSIISNNTTTRDILFPRFRDTINDFRPTSQSPMIDAGISVSDLGLNKDMDDLPRPVNNAYDIGCFEYQGGNAVENLLNEGSPIVIQRIYATNSSINIHFSLKITDKLQFSITGLNGTCIARKATATYRAGDHCVSFDKISLGQSVYLLTVKGLHSAITQKIKN